LTSPIDDRRRSRRRARPEVRRRYPRVRFDLDGFYSSPDREIMIKGGNLNLRGTFVRTAAPDPAGTRATLRLVTPGVVAMMKVGARVIWSNEDPGHGPVGMGLRFDGLDGWQLKRIASMMLKQGGAGSLPGILKKTKGRSNQCGTDY
jgi:hypothetical protein